MTWRGVWKGSSRAASPWCAVVFAAWTSAMLHTLCSAPSRLFAFCCWALESMSVMVRAPTTMVPRAVAAACAVARSVGSRTLTHTITIAAHAHAPWNGPRLGHDGAGMGKTVRQDGIIFQQLPQHLR